LKHQLTFLNEVVTAAALQIRPFLHLLLLFWHLIILWKNNNKEKRKWEPNVQRNQSLLLSLSIPGIPGVMTCSSNNLGSLEKISFSYNVGFMTMWQRNATIKKNHVFAAISSGSHITL
jgi:hypothetical protein